jgi:hypothetical protein
MSFCVAVVVLIVVSTGAQSTPALTNESKQRIDQIITSERDRLNIPGLACSSS